MGSVILTVSQPRPEMLHGALWANALRKLVNFFSGLDILVCSLFALLDCFVGAYLLVKAR